MTVQIIPNVRRSSVKSVPAKFLRKIFPRTCLSFSRFFERASVKHAVKKLVKFPHGKKCFYYAASRVPPIGRNHYFCILTLKNFRKVSHSFLRPIKKDCAKIAFPAVYTEETFWVFFLGDIFIIVESGNLLIQCLGDFFYLVKMFETILFSKRLNHSVNVKEYVFIIEIKTDSTPDEALAQIEEKGYARPFADDPRRVFRIGVNFSTANRRIDGWKVIG